jgi:F-type H+-transporting ATPase subunit delta
VASPIVARNYAETLLSLAERNGGRPTVDAFLEAATVLAALVRSEPGLRRFLETPRISPDAKRRALHAALAGRAPELFVRFVEVVVEKRRQALLPEIADAYAGLVDRMLGRTRVRISLASEPDAALKDEIARSLEQRLGTAVVPTFAVEPQLIGGVVVRVGDQVLDGSVRRRAHELRRRMLAAELPRGAPAQA